ncbi:MAG TPA: universal stress protein [Polyangiaceae bacterium]
MHGEDIDIGGQFTPTARFPTARLPPTDKVVGPNMVRKILCALDGSPRAEHVFDAAAELAPKFGAELRLLRVITIPPEFPAAGAGSETDTLPAYLTSAAANQLADFLRRAPTVPAAAPIVAVGQAWRVILETARTEDVDLIVIGSHGYHGWDRVLGTTAGKVVNLADRNVLVVHARS